MGQKLEWFKTPKVNPAVYIISIISLFYFAFMETDLFEGLPDMAKILYYAIPIIATALLGINILAFRKLAQRIIEIYKDKNKTFEEKAQEMFEAAEDALILGKVFLEKAKEE